MRATIFEMTLQRSSGLVLVALLAIHGAAAVMPHVHGPTIAGGELLSVAAAPEGQHQCLACAVHAPVVKAATDCGFTAQETSRPSIRENGLCAEIDPELPFSGPRGPPSVV